MVWKTRVFMPVVLAAAATFGCASLRQTLGLALVPTATEVQLGQELVGQIESEQKLLQDSVVQNYISTVFAGVAQYAAQDRSDITYNVKVIDDADQVNAFAVPGGHVYLYTGLLKLADNEAEVAGVMAHELGHLVARHSASQLGTQMGLAMLSSIALGDQPGQLASLADQLVTASAMASFSRDDEEEADKYGLRYSAAAGYSPAGLESFFNKLLKLEGGASTSVFEGLLGSHPATQDRIDLLRSRIERGGYTGGKLEAARYLKIRARL
jgi:beta-barrel assembly-enhancing protease